MVESQRSRRLKAREESKRRAAASPAIKAKKPRKTRLKQATNSGKASPSIESTEHSHQKHLVSTDTADAVNKLISGESPPRVLGGLIKKVDPEKRRSMSPENKLESSASTSSKDDRSAKTSIPVENLPPKKRFSPRQNTDAYSSPTACSLPPKSSASVMPSDSPEKALQGEEHTQDSPMRRSARKPVPTLKRRLQLEAIAENKRVKTKETARSKASETPNTVDQCLEKNTLPESHKSETPVVTLKFDLQLTGANHEVCEKPSFESSIAPQKPGVLSTPRKSNTSETPAVNRKLDRELALTKYSETPVVDKELDLQLAGAKHEVCEKTSFESLFAPQKSALSPPKTVVIEQVNSASSPSESDSSRFGTNRLSVETEKESLPKKEYSGSFDTDDSSWRPMYNREKKEMAETKRGTVATKKRESIDLLTSSSEEESLVGGGDDESVRFVLPYYYIDGSRFCRSGNDIARYYPQTKKLQICWSPFGIRQPSVDFEAKLDSKATAFHFDGEYEVRHGHSSAIIRNFVYIMIPSENVIRCGQQTGSEVAVLLQLDSTKTVYRLKELLCSVNITRNPAKFNEAVGALRPAVVTMLQRKERFAETEFTKTKSPGEQILKYPLGIYPAEPESLNQALSCLDELNVGDNGGKDYRGLLVEVSTDDYLTLQPMTWVTDAIVNLWMALITRGKSDVFCCTSLLYTKLDERGPEHVAKWAARDQLFSKRLVLIPINESGHWSLVAIFNLDSIHTESDRSPPYFVFLDSLRVHNRHKIELLVKGFLKAASKNLGLNFTSDRFRHYSPNVALQGNGYDCGIYTCLYASALIRAKEALASCPISGDSGEEALHHLFSQHSLSGIHFHFPAERSVAVRKGFQSVIENLHELYKASDLDTEPDFWATVKKNPKKDPPNLKQQPPILGKQENIDEERDPSATKQIKGAGFHRDDSMAETVIKENAVDNKNQRVINDIATGNDLLNKKPKSAASTVSHSYLHNAMQGEKGKDDETKICKPKSAFVFYTKHFRSLIREENPGLKSIEIQKILASRWKEEEQFTKTRFKMMATHDKKRYEKECLLILEHQIQQRREKMGTTSELRKQESEAEVYVAKRKETNEKMGTTSELRKQESEAEVYVAKRKETNGPRTNRKTKIVESPEVNVKKEKKLEQRAPYELGKASYICTQYLSADADFARVRALNYDLDGVLSDHQWRAMSDVERKQHVITRIASAGSAGCTRHVSTPEHQQLASSVGQLSTTPILPRGSNSSKNNSYATHYSSTPARDKMLKATINTAKSQIKSKSITGGGMKAQSKKIKSITWDESLEKPGGRDSCNGSMDTDSEYDVYHDKKLYEKKGRNKPVRLEQVLRRDSRRIIQRAAFSLKQRNETSFNCKPHWPQTFQILGHYNEISRNVPGKALVEGRRRERPQWNFLVTNDQQKRTFMKSVGDGIDKNKYDFFVTDDPDEFTDRFAKDEEGKKLSYGASVDANDTFAKLIAKKKEAQKIKEEKDW